MLTIITGTEKTGQKNRLLAIARQAAEKQGRQVQKKLLWLAPDQFTFETERELFHKLPPFVRVRMTVTGFSRYAEMIMKEYGGTAVRYADDLCKSILIRRALSDCRDMLKLYGRQAKFSDPAFEEQLLAFIRQMKFSGIGPNALLEAGKNPDFPENLRAKATDLAGIAWNYEMRLHSAWRDSLDDLSAAVQKIADREKNFGEKFFAGKTILLDGFKSFTAPQYDLLRLMLRQGASVYVSLCLDTVQARKELYSIYALTLDTYERLEALAGGHCAEERFPAPAPETGLELLKQHLFDEPLSPGRDRKPDDTVEIFSCRDEYAEAEFCFGRLKSLVKDRGYRLRELAVVYRDEAEYRLPIAAAAMKFELPYCVDGGSAPRSEPLFTVCTALLKAAFLRFTAVDALTIIKSGLFAAEAEEITQLEEYWYVWRPEGLREWKSPFAAELSGYEIEEAGTEKKTGDAPERLRARLMGALTPLLAVESETAQKIGTLLYEALGKIGAIERFAAGTAAEEDLKEQMERKRIWNSLGEILTRLSDTAAEEKITGAEYYRLFVQSVQETKIKAVEQTMDCILVGSADRIRLENPKVVWILGANEGIFPRRPNGQSGLFSDAECRQMSDFDIIVGKTAEEQLSEERFTALQMVSSPAEKLVLSCRKADLGGERQLAGELIWRCEALLGITRKPGVLSEADRMTTAAAVFESYCELVREEPEKAEKYLQLLEKLPDNPYEPVLGAVRSMQEPKRYALTGSETIESLYALYQRMLSPSEIEQYYRCPFAYFVKYGLKLRVRERAAYNPLLRGNIVHHVIALLTPLLSAMAKEDAKKAADEGIVAESAEIKEKIRVLVRETFEKELALRFENPGKICAKDRALAESMLLTVQRIAENIYAEQLQSKFEVLAVECDIGGREIAPLSIPVEQDRNIRIRGRIDRLDIYYDDKKKYFRIIDYKTGNVKFEYASLISGEHLQMILYEMAAACGGKGRFSGLQPAGVLYYPAKRPALADQHQMSESEREDHLSFGFCMNGVVVDDKATLDRVQAMEKALEERYIPVGYNKKREMDESSLRTEEEYRRIEGYVRSKVRHMAKEVSGGGIEPVYHTDTTPCTYCEYKELCGKDIRIESCEAAKLNEDEARQIVYGEENE